MAYDNMEYFGLGYDGKEYWAKWRDNDTGKEYGITMPIRENDRLLASDEPLPASTFESIDKDMARLNKERKLNG